LFRGREFTGLINLKFTDVAPSVLLESLKLYILIMIIYRHTVSLVTCVRDGFLLLNETAILVERWTVVT
jgi:hypothetical protein